MTVGIIVMHCHLIRNLHIFNKWLLLLLSLLTFILTSFVICHPLSLLFDTKVCNVKPNWNNVNTPACTHVHTAANKSTNCFIKAIQNYSKISKLKSNVPYVFSIKHYKLFLISTTNSWAAAS